ncbi:MAG TPA: thiamine phosphate synthase, partial [Thermomicrobiales bacterium]|nr:thiamine phosphate synthase [Thermomicrobiales bacterium]
MTLIPRFMVVLDQAGCLLPITEVAREAIAGGADMLQIREKALPDADLREEIEAIIKAVGGPERIAINGRPDLAEEYGTHLHLPESMPFPPDLPWEHRLIGRSVHLPIGPLDPGLRYLILGPVMRTASKPDAAGIGLTGLTSASANLNLPVLAIGGMQADQIKGVLDAGTYGVAVRSTVI